MTVILIKVGTKITTKEESFLLWLFQKRAIITAMDESHKLCTGDSVNLMKMALVHMVPWTSETQTFYRDRTVM